MSLLTEYIVDRLQQVVDAQPADHPLRIQHIEETRSDGERSVAGKLEEANYIRVRELDTVGQSIRGRRTHRRRRT